MKKRHIKDVEADERVEIAEESQKGLIQMKDIAAKHHISRHVVYQICKDYKDGGVKIEKKRSKNAKESQLVHFVTEEVSQMLMHSQPIWCSTIIQ